MPQDTSQPMGVILHPEDDTYVGSSGSDTEKVVRRVDSNSTNGEGEEARRVKSRTSTVSMRRVHSTPPAPGEPDYPIPAAYDGDISKDPNDEPYYHTLDGQAPIPACPGSREEFLIDWQSDEDSDNPQTWSFGKKLLCMAGAAFSAMATVFGSAVAGPATPEVMHVFHVGLPVATLCISLYILGFALGPIVWGPMSEQFGRRLPLILAMFGLTVFSFGCAVAKDFQTLIICRFFAGTISAGTLSVAPVIPADIFNGETRGRGIAIISLMIIAGPMLAPVVGGYIASSYLGWRWVYYILGIFGALMLVIVVIFMPETYAPAILAARAKKIRSQTGNWAVVAKLETQEFTITSWVEKTLSRPLKMLVVEPILFLISLYHGFIYGILYLCLECVPLIFSEYGWHGGNIYLPYLGMLVGTILVIALNLLYFEPLFDRRIAASPVKILPEARLPLMMMCGIIFPMGIFLLCWSGAYRVMWFVPTLGCALIGFALIGIFMSAFNYIIDTYLMLAASGIAANTFLRSGFGCAFPLFAHPLFVNLGTQWAGTLLGCLAVLLAPVPFLFYIYGKRIRQKSKYAIVIGQ